MKALFVISSLVVLALTACGGGSGGAATLTKAEYDAKLSHLCLVAADQFRELHLDNTLASWRHEAPDVIRIDQNFAHKLAALKPPKTIAAAAAGYRRASSKASQDDRNAVAAADAGNAANLLAAIKQANKDNTATFPAAKAIGARGCYL